MNDDHERSDHRQERPIVRVVTRVPYLYEATGPSRPRISKQCWKGPTSRPRRRPTPWNCRDSRGTGRLQSHLLPIPKPQTPQEERRGIRALQFLGIPEIRATTPGRRSREERGFLLDAGPKDKRPDDVELLLNARSDHRCNNGSDSGIAGMKQADPARKYEVEINPRLRGAWGRAQRGHWEGVRRNPNM